MTNKAFGALLALGLTGCVASGYNNSYPPGYIAPQAFGPQDGPTVQYDPPPGYDYDYLRGSQTIIILPGGGIWDLRRGAPHDRFGHELPPSFYARPRQEGSPPSINLRGPGEQPLFALPPRGAPYGGRPGIMAVPQPLHVIPGRPAIAAPPAGVPREERRLHP